MLQRAAASTGQRGKSSTAKYLWCAAGLVRKSGVSVIKIDLQSFIPPEDFRQLYFLREARPRIIWLM